MMVLIRLTVIILLGVASPAMAQEGSGTDTIRDSAIRLRDSGLETVGSMRNAVGFRARFGLRRSVEVDHRDEIWLVDARDSQRCPSDLSLINVKKFQNGIWNPACLDELASNHLTDPSRETVFYIHGNQTDDRWSVTRGIQVYRNLFKNCCDRKPIRLVIWQWKSERACAGWIQDYYIKSARAAQLGTTLALTLGQFHDRNITVIGFSLGAQITLSAMRQKEASHLAGGKGYRIALIAPALDCTFTRQAIASPTVGSLIEQTYIFFNTSDRVLNIRLLVCKKHQGPNYVTLPELIQMQIMSLGQIKQYDVGNDVGKMHCIVRYSSSATIQSEINFLISSRIWCEEPVIGSSVQDASRQKNQTNEFLIHDPIQDLDSSLPSTRAYLLDPVVTP